MAIDEKVCPGARLWIDEFDTDENRLNPLLNVRLQERAASLGGHGLITLITL